MPQTVQTVVQGIDAIMIYADDPRSLADWYATHLGIVTSPEKDGNYYGEVVDEKAGKSVHIGIYSNAERVGKDGRPVMVNYRIEDFDTFLTTMEERNVKIEKVIDESYGRFAYFRDGEGNRIEVWSPNPLLKASHG